jgi:glyoxylase-like metal-dependent hydrolase (beta-lactamase superfamily II)
LCVVADHEINLGSRGASVTDGQLMVTEDPINATPQFSGPAREVAPGVFLHPLFVNTYAVKTPLGLLLIDPGTARGAPLVHAAIRGWSSDPIHTVVYTHGHFDHAFGLKPFIDEGNRPQIVSQENLPARFHRYRLTHGLNEFINRRQFGIDNIQFPDTYDWPTLTFRDSLAQRIGDLDVRYCPAKGETDDHCFIWLPQRGYLFCGDLIIWRSPNCGNPQKVQRYPVEWAEALERMAALEAEWLFPGHGLVVKGQAAVRRVLTETAQYLRGIIDQVLLRLNAGEAPDDIFHAVNSDPELASRPYLLELYDHPKFIVRNLIRQWGGWWNGNAADLFPATAQRQAVEISALAGGVGSLVARGRDLLTAGDLEMASHIAEWASRANPADPAAQKLKRDVYERRTAATDNLMAQGIYRGAMNEAHLSLGEPPKGRPGSLSL